ncbi:hypothetical protein GNX71_18560 [Variovorax sp. RKNM96]|uniref:hypothetical protein n=1 Tax=Variovorax sp. RKNM96 TaxID=2681552 RepID=UPI00197E3A37|nr:hypothetical protein [Variovorax sp. RKNM96]QSI31471.1 hypothetical protein GNX71_18560 [Variovorax sp. RKNM96]
MANATPIVAPEVAPEVVVADPSLAAKLEAAGKTEKALKAAAAKLDASFDPALVSARDEALAAGKQAFIVGNAVRIDN